MKCSKALKQFFKPLLRFYVGRALADIRRCRYFEYQAPIEACDPLRKERFPNDRVNSATMTVVLRTRGGARVVISERPTVQKQG